MWSLITSALRYLFNLVFRVSAIKFAVFTAVYWLITALWDLAKSLLGEMDWFTGLPTLIASLPSGFLFYLQLFRLDVGLPMIVAAMVIRFGIRRLPIIG